MITRRLLLRAGDEFTLAGPALLKVDYGELNCLGKKIHTQEGLLIRQGKLLPFIVVEDASIEVRYQSENDMRSLTPSEAMGIKIWSGMIERVVEHVSNCGKCLIIALGPVNSGKSTLLTYIANSLLRLTNSLIVDTDIGQNDLGPPGSLAAGFVTQPITDLREIMPSAFDFIGFVSAGFDIRYVTERIIMFVRKMQDVYQEKQVVLVNTDGFVQARGLESKIQLIKELNPHLVIITDSELKQSLEQFSPTLIEARKPQGIVKSRHDRVSRRLLQYLKFLKDSRQRHLDLKGLELRMMGRQCKLIGPLPENRESVSVFLKRNVIYVPFNALIDMFVALLYEEEVKGFGVIAGWKKEQGLLVRTPVREDVDQINLSMVRLPNLAKEEFIRIAADR
jgi:polynucleotide 5'-hydroxyl-kinase GRC3/NOL9